MRETNPQSPITNIVSLTGFIGCGKSTVAKHLVNVHGYTEITFAKKLKDVVSVVFGWDRSLLEGDTLESRQFRETEDEYWSSKCGYLVTPRIIFQKVGTEAFRKVVHNDIWINAALKPVYQNPTGKFVISDARFRNEIQACKELGATMWRIKRGEDPEWFETALAANTYDPMKYLEIVNIHLSERDWIGTKFDYQVTNDETVEHLKNKIDRHIDQLNRIEQ